VFCLSEEVLSLRDAASTSKIGGWFSWPSSRSIHNNSTGTIDHISPSAFEPTPTPTLNKSGDLSKKQPAAPESDYSGAESNSTKMRTLPRVGGKSSYSNNGDGGSAATLTRVQAMSELYRIDSD